MDRKAFGDIEFYKRLLHDRYDNTSIPQLVKYASTNNRPFNKKIVEIVI